MMKKKIFSAGAVIVCFYLLSQGVRLLANIYVARLLSPEMFGLMATVFVIQQGVAMISDVGLDSFLIRHSDYKNKSILNGVWTLQLIRGAILAVVISLIALLLYVLQAKVDLSAIGIMGSSELPALILLSALIPFFTGFRSMARIINTRELNRLKVSALQFVSQVAGAAVMVAWAVYYQSVWSLAIAGPVSIFVLLIFDYSFFDMRHRISLNKSLLKEVYHFGKWIFLATILTYVAAQGDKLYLSFTINPKELGLYSIALSLAAFMVQLVQRFSCQLWLPVFSNNASDFPKLKKQYFKIRLMQDFAVCVFVILGMFLADDVIGLLYDERYEGVFWMLKILLPLAMANSLTETSKVLLMAVNKTKVQMQSMIVRALSLTLLLPLLFNLWQIKGVIVATVVSAFLSYIPQAIALNKLSLLSKRSELITLLLMASVFGVLFLQLTGYWQ